MTKRRKEAHRQREFRRCHEERRPFFVFLNSWHVKWSGFFQERWTFQKVLFHFSVTFPSRSGKRCLLSLARLGTQAVIAHRRVSCPADPSAGSVSFPRLVTGVSEEPCDLPRRCHSWFLEPVFISLETCVFTHTPTPKKEASYILRTPTAPFFGVLTLGQT